MSVLILGLFTTGALAAINLPPSMAGRDAAFALIFSPWTSSADAAMASWTSGLRVVRPGALPFILIVAGSADGQVVAKPAAALLAIRLDGLVGCGVRGVADLAG